MEKDLPQQRISAILITGIGPGSHQLEKLPRHTMKLAIHRRAHGARAHVLVAPILLTILATGDAKENSKPTLIAHL